ncbi:MAG: hypothetical protein KBE65_16315 [Phycisphaerae bacterium]|nr:hypothetical protein [Phycisphaerae bacterium]
MFDLPPAPARTESPALTEVGDTTDSEPQEPRSVFDALLYPLNVSGIIHLLIFSLLPPVWKEATTFRFWESPGIAQLCYLVILTLYFVHYVTMCLSHSAGGGRRAPDINGDSSPLSTDALLSTGKTVLPIVALIWGPPLAYHVVRERVDWILLAWTALAGFAFPMVLLAVNDFDSARAANPLLVVPSIASVFRPYCLLLLCLLPLMGLAGLLMYAAVGPWKIWLARPLMFYILLVEIHLLGRFYERHEERLNWGI